MLQTRSNIFLVAQVNTSAGGSAVVISNSSNIFITNTSLTVMVQNSAGWVMNASSTILNSAGWIVNVANTGGAFSITNSAGWVVSASSTILNSAGWIVNVANTGGSINVLNSGGLFAMQSGTWTVGLSTTANTSVIQNSGGLYAMQSGVWAVSSTILNSAGWLVNASCTILNSAGWVVANTGRTDIILNSGGLYSMQSGVWTVSATILNSAGWVVANTGRTDIILNSGGLYSMQSGLWTVSSTILNSAGWIVSVANTAGSTVYALDSAATGAVVTSIVSTVGTVVLAVAQAKRVSLSVYNASTNPLFLKMGSGAKTTDFTLMMVASGYYEVARPIYNGQITGVWATANGNAYVTETT